MRFLIVLALMMSAASMAHAAPILDQDTIVESQIGGGAIVGQGFGSFSFEPTQTVTAGVAGTLTSVALHLRAVTAPLRLTIYDGELFNPSGIAGSVDIPLSQLPPDFPEIVTVDVSGLGLKLDVGDFFALALSALGGGDGRGQWLEGSGYSGGVLISLRNDGETFLQGLDTGFRTYVDPTFEPTPEPVPEPAAIGMLGLGVLAVGMVRRRLSSLPWIWRRRVSASLTAVCRA